MCQVFGTINGRKVEAKWLPRMQTLSDIEKWVEKLKDCTLYQVRGEVWVSGWLKRKKTGGQQTTLEKVQSLAEAMHGANETLSKDALEQAKKCEESGRKALKDNDLKTAHNQFKRALLIQRPLFSGKERAALIPSLRSLAEIASRQAAHSIALLYNEEILSICRETYGSSHVEVAKACSSVGESYMGIDDYANALPMLMSAVSFFEKDKNGFLNYFQTLSQLAKCHFQLKEYEKTLQNIDRVAQLFKPGRQFPKDSVYQLQLIKRQSEILLERETVGNLFCLPFLKGNFSDPLTAEAAFQIGKTCLIHNPKSSVAVDFFNLALNLFSNTEEVGRFECHMALGDFYRRCDRLKDAANQYQAADKVISEDFINYGRKATCNFSLGCIYEQMGYLKEAYASFLNAYFLIHYGSNPPKNLFSQCVTKLLVLSSNENATHSTPVISAKWEEQASFLEAASKKDEELKKFDEAITKLEEALVIRSAKSDKKDSSAKQKIADLHLKIAGLYSDEQLNPFKAEPHYEAYLDWCKVYENAVHLCRAYFEVANCKNKVRKKEEALKNGKEALRLLNSLQLQEVTRYLPAVIHHGLGEAFGSDFIERSIEHFETAIRLYSDIGEYRDSKAQAYIQLAQLFVLKNDEIKAIDLLKKGITLYEKLSNTRTRVFEAKELLRYLESDKRVSDWLQLFDQRADEYAQSNQLQEELAERKKSLELLLKFYGDKNHPKIAQTYFELAVRYLKQKHKEKARECLEAYLPIVEKLFSADFVGIAFCCLKLGEIDAAENNPLQAIIQFEKSKAIFEKSRMEEPLAETLYKMAFAWYQFGHYPAAISYYERALALSDKLTVNPVFSQRQDLVRKLEDRRLEKLKRQTLPPKVDVEWIGGVD